MVNITKENFSVRQICESGQCFRLLRLDEETEKKERAARTSDGKRKGEQSVERYGLTAFGRYLEMEQMQDAVAFHCTQEEFEGIWKGYFDLEEDYGKIIGMIDSRDAYLLEAAAYGSGIRILRQDLWEMIISFIISQQNNIKRIRKCIDLLCRRYGEKKKTDEGLLYYDFPKPEVLAAADLEDLYACNLGYRSRYVRNTAQCIERGEVDLKAVSVMGYEEAKTELLKLCGVGVKVAECICLFALHKTEAFPIDTHINKVLASQYPKGFPFERYKGYEGTLQQYIFYYDLMKR